MRNKCIVDGCRVLGRNKGYYNGKIRYDKYCEWHHKKAKPYFDKQGIENKSCEICGWDKAPCDRHRIEPEKGYTKKNVMILCPNCHRLKTLGL